MFDINTMPGAIVWKRPSPRRARPASAATLWQCPVAHEVQPAGRVIEQAYFDANGQPVQTSEGFSIVRLKVDDRGNRSERCS